MREQRKEEREPRRGEDKGLMVDTGLNLDKLERRKFWVSCVLGEPRFEMYYTTSHELHFVVYISCQ